MVKFRLNRGQKKRLLSIVSGCGLFFVGAVLHLFHLPLPSALCFIGAGVCAGIMCVTRAARGILSGNFFDENTLMTIAAVGAVLLGEYAECAAVMVLYQVGELFQSIAVGKSRRAISSLSALCPDYANLVTSGEERTVAPSELQIGDIIRIKPGERIPVDCIIETGETAVDTSPVTGESVPRDLSVGDKLFSGCINQTGVVVCRVDAATEDSAAGRILRLAETASDRKTRSEAFITRFAKVYTPLVCLLAITVAFCVPSILWALRIQSFGDAFIEWSSRALTMLVISCPCALVISVPLGYFCGLGNASKNGILVKGSTFIDSLAKVKNAVFDKTGTLTEGELMVTDVEGGYDKNEILSLARAAEENSSHPIAKAILAVAENKYTAVESKEISGTGVFAILEDGRKIKVIRPEKGVIGTAVDVICNEMYLGRIYFEDVIKPTAGIALKKLKKQGIEKCIMLTGDNSTVAENVGAALKMDEVYSQLLPEDKYEKIEELCRQGAVMYVGDGINDSPSLARADVGVAMGVLGSGAAIESGDIVLMSRDLEKLSYAHSLSKRTVRTVKANIIISLGVKLAVLLFAALNLVGMWAAIVADVGVCILCVTNSVRLLK